jgi:hypothetical protein
MRCAVITPVGPGQERLFHECIQSVQTAIQQSKEPFDEISTTAIDDTSSAKRRSAVQNKAFKRAQSANIEWFFFLDAKEEIHYL